FIWASFVVEEIWRISASEYLHAPLHHLRLSPARARQDAPLKRLWPAGPPLPRFTHDLPAPTSAILRRMKQVEFFRWWIPDDREPSKLRRTNYVMTRKQAAERFPGARPDEATREVRLLPETPDEIGRNMHGGGQARR